MKFMNELTKKAKNGTIDFIKMAESELIPQDPNDQLASILIKRIKVKNRKYERKKH